MSAGGSRRRARHGRRGFTLVELLVVLLMIAIASGLVGLALRQGDDSRLEREAVRLAALLEAGRAEARASGIAVRFELRAAPADGGADAAEAFRFAGLPAGTMPVGRWLVPGVSARIDGGGALRLGPEPLIGAQRIVLALGDRQLALATDGLAPFSVEPAGNGAAPAAGAAMR